MHQRTEGYIVAPLSRADIRQHAEQVREALGIKTAWFPILDVVERILPEVWPNFVFEVLPET